MKEFWTAFLNAQKEFLPVVKDCVNPHFKSKYASLESIMRAVKPALSKYGIAITMPLREDKVFVILTHAETGQFIDSFTPFANQASDLKIDEQKKKSAITYQRRSNLEGLTGVVATDDDDANEAVSQNSDEREYADRWTQSSELAKSLGLYDNIKSKHITAYKNAFDRQYKNLVTTSDIRKFLNDFSKERA